MNTPAPSALKATRVDMQMHQRALQDALCFCDTIAPEARAQATRAVEQCKRFIADRVPAGQARRQTTEKHSLGRDGELLRLFLHFHSPTSPGQRDPGGWAGQTDIVSLLRDYVLAGYIELDKPQTVRARCASKFPSGAYPLEAAVLAGCRPAFELFLELGADLRLTSNTAAGDAGKDVSWLIEHNTSSFQLRDFRDEWMSIAAAHTMRKIIQEVPSTPAASTTPHRQPV